MIETTEIQQPVKVVTKFTCDRCGVESAAFEGQPIADIAHFTHTFGYYAEELDNSEIEFDLCSKCLMEILKNENVRYRLQESYYKEEKCGQ